MTGKWAATNTLRGRHSIGCPAGRGARNLPGPCECGHDAALALMEAALDAAQGVSREIQEDAPIKCLICAMRNGEHVDDCPAPILAAALRAVREGTQA